MEKENKVIFESEDGGNIIIDTGNEYILLSSNGRTACFDRNKKIFNKVKNAIEKEGNWQASENNGFFMLDCNWKLSYSLAQLIICTVYHKKLSYIRKGKMTYLDNNKFNCCIDNLDCSKISNMKTSPYLILHNDEYIYLKHKPSGKTARLTYIEDLYDVMCGIRWNYDERVNSFYTKINIKNKSTQLFLYQLCFIFYYYKDVTKRNYKTKILEYKKNFAKYDLTVDHADSDRLNNCIFNISAMEKGLNVRKSDITIRIIFPYFYFGVYTDGVYRVAIGQYLDSTEQDCEDEVLIQGYQCDTAESYVELLKDFYDQGVLPNGDSFPDSPKKWYDTASEDNRKHIDKVLPIDKETIIKELLRAANLPLYEGKKDIKYAS